MKNTCSITKRYIVVFLVLFGLCIGIILNLNLSVTIIKLTSKKNITVENEIYETVSIYGYRLFLYNIT